MNKTIAAALAATLAAGALALAPAAADAATAHVVRPAGLNTSETRAAGHVDFLRDGLHVYTDDATSLAKAAGYFDVADPTFPTSASLSWEGTQPQPGQQLVFDVDGVTGNGNDYNVLVGEPVYGQNWWLTNGSSSDAKAADPSGADDGGNGSAYFGTLADWKAALPNARVLKGGFSLGSGVKGDGVVSRVQYGVDVYEFTSVANDQGPKGDPGTPAPAAAALTPTDVTGGLKVHRLSKNRALLVMKSAARPDGAEQRFPLHWAVLVDGEVVATLDQGFSETDTVLVKVPRVARTKRTHHVNVIWSGLHSKTFRLTTTRR